MLKKLFFIFLLLNVINGFAQTGDMYIGVKRSHLQTQLRDYSIAEYEREYTGFQVKEGVMLYIFFDEEQLCEKYYWLVDTNLEQATRDTLQKNGWIRKQENLLTKDSTTCTISTMNEGKNTLFLVESPHRVAQAKTKEITKAPIQLAQKHQPDPKTTKAATLKKEWEAAHPKPVEEPKFQGLKIWGWEVIKW